MPNDHLLLAGYLFSHRLSMPLIEVLARSATEGRKVTPLAKIWSPLNRLISRRGHIVTPAPLVLCVWITSGGRILQAQARGRVER